MAGTVGDRVFAVRLALGDGKRTPLAMRGFADLLNGLQSVRKYDASVLSNIETGKRAVGLDEVGWIASLDPLRRGRAWLAFGDEADAQPAEPGKSGPIHMAGDGTMFGQPPTVVTPKRVAGTKRAR